MRSHTRLLLVGAMLLPGFAPQTSFATEGKERPRENPRALVAEDDARSAYLVALSLEAEGRATEATAAYRRVIRFDTDHAAARRALGYERVKGLWIHQDESREAKGFVQQAGRWVLREEATPPSTRTAEGIAGLDRRLLARSAKTRLEGIRALEALSDPASAVWLTRACLEDKDARVRTAAVGALRTLRLPSTAKELVQALSSSSEPRRVRAAEALGRLRDAKAYPYLIRTWEKRAGEFPHSYFSYTRQVAYLQDFDTEVA